jgi:hypothetical protein
MTVCLLSSRPRLLPSSSDIKIKVKLSLWLNNYAQRREDIWRSRGIAPLFLTSALDEDEYTAPRPGSLNPRYGTPGTHWIGSCVGPRSSLDVVES